MVQVISKLAPINATCIEYVHPWTRSCMEASAGLYLYSIYDSLRIYSTVYMVRFNNNIINKNKYYFKISFITKNVVYDNYRNNKEYGKVQYIY